MIRGFLTVGMLVALSSCASTNELSNAELEGRHRAKELLEQSPAESSSLDGVLRIRDSKKKRSEIPIRCQVVLTETRWRTIYETSSSTNSPIEKLVITHNGTNPSRYELNGTVVPNTQTAVAFSGSDFYLADLGLEFLHWPTQRILKKELRRSRSCEVLESSNPEIVPHGYARVVSWIDRETGGIVHAEAYDANGKKTKEFDPKEFKKVNGQWQLQEMQIRNIQTGSRTSLEFNLNPK